MDCVLDAVIVAELCRSGDRGRLIAQFLRAKRVSGMSLVVVPQVIVECEQAGGSTSDRLLTAVSEWCSGVLSREAGEVMGSELSLPNPYASALAAGSVAVSRLAELRRSRREEEVQSFLHEQRLDYAGLREAIPGLRRAAGGIGTLPPFGEYVEGRWPSAFRSFLEYAVASGALRFRVPSSESELERLWRRSFAYRLVVLVIIANEYRVANGSETGSGSLTDGRNLIESAYADEFLTMDKSLFESGKLIMDAGLHPVKFLLWTAA